MAVQAVADESCAAFDGITSPLEPRAVHRFVVGEDAGPTPMSAEAATQELGDPVAALLFLRGRFPRTAAELVDQLRKVADGADPLQQHATFVLGEGSQVAFSDDTATVDRGLRFLIACGKPTEPDVIMSTPAPDAPFVELMAWDRKGGGFNFYRTVDGAWVFAGNSRAALVAPTEGKGPFDSHVTGNLLMKELRKPWIHWHSSAGHMIDTVFALDDPRRRHDWFTQRQGADVFEKTVARPSIRRWTEARFEASAGPPGRVMKQILDTSTVNLIASHTESRRALSAGDPVKLPQTFFVDSEALTEVLGLPAPPALSVEAQLYAAALARFEFTLRAAGGFSQPGDSRFAFIVPERAFEDRVALEQAIDRKLVTPRLAACLLMVDFANPVFSARRATLLSHLPEAADEDLSQALAEAILAASKEPAAGAAELEFATLWAAGDDWPKQFGALLNRYYATLPSRVASRTSFDDYVRLAESRRQRVRKMPIFENRLLFPETNITPENLEMRPDGTVVQGAQT